MRISAYLFGLQPLVAEGAVVFAKACEMGLEGIVSKREGSFYTSGRSRNWLKMKNPDFVRTSHMPRDGSLILSDVLHGGSTLEPALF
jgi:ATP-dependent DNA ligase